MSAQKRVREFHLYIDESGTFTETATGKNNPGQSFPSQIVGFFAPKETFSKLEAARIIREGHVKAGLTLRDEFHANEISSKPKLCLLTDYVVSELLDKKWQPTRLVNKEGVPYGNKVQCYTNMVAEFILRIFQHLSIRHPGEQILIRFDYAVVDLRRGSKDKSRLLPRDEYKTRIDEYLWRAAVWRGLPLSDWQVLDYHQGSARRVSELQICDLLSYVSHADYSPLRPQGSETTQKLLSDTRELVQNAFGEYDHSMAFRELLERADRLLEEGAYGVALVALLQEIAEDDFNDRSDYGRRVGERLQVALDALTAMGFRGRDPHLSIMVSWLDHLVGHERALAYGSRLSKLLLDRVASGLEERLDGTADRRTLDWFRYALHRWALTTANHRGEVYAARREVDCMDRTVAALASRFEHAPLLMDGFIAQAVHYTDCFDFEATRAKMLAVTDSLKAVSDSYKDAFSRAPAAGVLNFAAGVRFDLRAKALGTLTQSETLAGLVDPSRLAVARRLSDEALDEFSNAYDRLRQLQYRCHIEAAAGEFVKSREFLARSLAPEDEKPYSSHRAIAASIRSFTESSPRQAFYLFHWLRVGALIYQSTDLTERRDFWAALRTSGLLDLGWCAGAECDYPAHGILRRIAFIRASEKEAAEALKTLNALRKLDPLGSGQPVLATIVLAAQAEVAGALWEAEPGTAKRLLEEVAADLIAFREKTVALPSMWQAFDQWPAVIQGILDGSNMPPATARGELIGLARMVGY